MKKLLSFTVLLLSFASLSWGYDSSVYSVVTVSSTDTTMGSVTGSGTYPNDTTITITATANSGYRFTQWSDGNIDNPRTITVSGDSSFTAQFAIGTAHPLYYRIISYNPPTVRVSNSSNDAFFSVDTYTWPNLVIPDSVTNNNVTYVVTAIADGAFAGCNSLTSVTIPNSVTSIGSNAFQSCNGLINVTIPNSVTSIGSNAFFYCENLINANISNSVTSIGSGAFQGCSSLTNITISNSVTSIGDAAFLGCNRLASITIPNSVTSIGSHTFYGCSSLTTVTIPDSVTSIGYNAFYGCIGLTSVVIGSSVITIGGYAFNGCSGLTSVVIGNSVTNIGGFAFNGCSGLTNVTIPNSVTSIGNYAFGGCSSLANVSIGNSVTSIGNNAFNGCSGLTNVTIPNSVTSIGTWAFGDCSSLTNVSIGNSVTSIGSGAFYGCSSLASVTIPNTVTSIGEAAFSNCSSLASVTIGYRVTSIGNNAFSGCTALLSMELRRAMPPTIYDRTFRCCYTNMAIAVPCGSVSAYQSANYWSNFTNYTSNCTTSIVNVLSADNTMGSTTGSGTYPNDTTITITATPNNGYHFTQWSDGDTTNPRTITVSTDSTFTAQFAQSNYSVTVSCNNTNYGVTTASASTVTYNQSVFIAATSNRGYYFQRWSDNHIDPVRIITVTSDTNFVAIFAPYSPIHDTTTIHDTVIYNNYIHDTTFVNNYIHDTLIRYVNHYIHDTTFVNNYIHDTTYLNNYIHDTSYVDRWHYDTTYVNHYIHDTAYVDRWHYDTTYVNHYIHDTSFVNNYIHDTTYLNRYIYDTTYVYDTIVNNYHDTLYVTDTVVQQREIDYYDLEVISVQQTGIAVGTGRYSDGTVVEIAAIPVLGNHFERWDDGSTENPRHVTMDEDRRYIAIFDVDDVSVTNVEATNITISADRADVTVRGAERQTIRIFDTNGRLLVTQTDAAEVQTFRMPASGAYLVQVGSYPAQRVVVLR